MQKTILLCVELSDILKFAKKHIRRAEDISLFPLPPHLSPSSPSAPQPCPLFSGRSSLLFQVAELGIVILHKSMW